MRVCRIYQLEVRWEIQGMSEMLVKLCPRYRRGAFALISIQGSTPDEVRAVSKGKKMAHGRHGKLETGYILEGMDKFMTVRNSKIFSNTPRALFISPSMLLSCACSRKALHAVKWPSCHCSSAAWVPACSGVGIAAGRAGTARDEERHQVAVATCISSYIGLVDTCGRR